MMTELPKAIHSGGSYSWTVLNDQARMKILHQLPKHVSDLMERKAAKAVEQL